ncbi:MAG: radical SAM protein [Candidatus Woesearchaeota archaeon]
MVGKRIIKVNTLDELYQDPKLYSTPNMFSPPSERRPHVIRFELTKGCNWGRCTYCNGYDGVPFQGKSLDEYFAHVNLVWDRMDPGLAKQLSRIFIGGGDALGLETEILWQAIRYTRKRFYNHTGNPTKRVAVYGRTQSILKQGSSGLERLSMNKDPDHRGGLHLVYWGVESGSDEILDYVHKGCTKEQMLEAGKLLQESGLQASVMIMPGLGGIKYYTQHVKETAELLGMIKPKFVTFMGINAPEHSTYRARMNEEVATGINRPLTDKETAQQMVDLVRAMPYFDTKLGCYDTSTDQVGHNPVNFGSRDIYGRISLRYLADNIEDSIRQLEKSEWAEKGRAIVEKEYRRNRNQRILTSGGYYLSNALLGAGLAGSLAAIFYGARGDPTLGLSIASLITAVTSMAGAMILPGIEIRQRNLESYFLDVLTNKKYAARLDREVS